MILPAMFSLFILTTINHGLLTANDTPWIPYVSLIDSNHGFLESIHYSCQRCSRISSDTNLAFREFSEKFNKINAIAVPCSNCSNVVGNMDSFLKAIKNFTTQGFKNQTDLIVKLSQDTEEIKKNCSETNSIVKKSDRKLDIITDQQMKQDIVIKSVDEKLQFLVDAKEREIAAVREKEAYLKVKIEEIKSREKKLEEQEREYKEKAIALEAMRIECDRKFKEAKEKEDSVRKLAAILEVRNKTLSDDIHKYEVKKESLEVNRLLLSNIAVAIGALAIFVAIFAACCIWRPSGGSKAQQAADLDVCHLSLTRERRSFFERTILPRLAALNLHPSIEYRVLMQPSDFNTIPKAKSFIVHWTSQRRSIFSANWTHRGLLRALGRKPFFIMVCDQEQAEALSDGTVYDSSFSQIQSETELREAAAANCLITYRRGENLNSAQEQVLKNWMNANIGEEFVS